MRVLVVSDERPRQRLLWWALREEGYADVEECDLDRLPSAIKDRPPACIIFNCGDLSADACAAQVRLVSGLAPEACIIVLTAAEDDLAAADRAIAFGPPHRIERIRHLLPPGA